jgi:hypothetical protein
VGTRATPRTRGAWPRCAPGEATAGLCEGVLSHLAGRPCRAAAQATRDGCRAAAPTGRRAARQRAAPRPPAPGSRPRRSHAPAPRPRARAGAAFAGATRPRRSRRGRGRLPGRDRRAPMPPGLAGGRAREPYGRRATPATGARGLARRRGARGRARRRGRGRATGWAGSPRGPPSR